MVCNNCGSELSPNAKFCSECGNTVSIEENSLPTEKLKVDSEQLQKQEKSGSHVVGWLIGILFVAAIVIGVALSQSSGTLGSPTPTPSRSGYANLTDEERAEEVRQAEERKAAAATEQSSAQQDAANAAAETKAARGRKLTVVPGDYSVSCNTNVYNNPGCTALIGVQNQSDVPLSVGTYGYINSFPKAAYRTATGCSCGSNRTLQPGESTQVQVTGVMPGTPQGGTVRIDSVVLLENGESSEILITFPIGGSF